MIKLYKGDCLEVMENIPDNSIDLIIADPPYFQGMTHNGQKGDFNDLKICKPFFDSLFTEFVRVLNKDTGKIYFFSDWRGYAFYYPIFSNQIPARNLIVWDKKGGAGNQYNFSHEFIIYGTLKPYNQGGSNVWRETSFSSGAKKTNGAKVHPTQKPVELIEKMILNSSKENDVVLDPFMGSGTTGIAALNTGRKFVGIELQDKYFNISCNRFGEWFLKDEVKENVC